MSTLHRRQPSMTAAWLVIALLALTVATTAAGETPPPVAPAPEKPDQPPAPPEPVLPPDTLTRGPYLCNGTPTSVVVRWRTSSPSIGRLWYGLDDKTLRTLDEAEATTEHEIVIPGLKADTRYLYRIGLGDKILAGQTGDCWFVTNPAPDTAKPTRIWVLGDSGTGNSAAKGVRNGFATYNGIQPINLWLMLGDNAYVKGSDADYQKGVFNMYPETLRTSVLWLTRGNHDMLYDGPNNDYYELFTLPTKGEAGGLASGTECYYSFNFGRIHFINLDSEGTSTKAASPMWTWLKQDLAQVQQDWIIAFWHHPPYSKGSHDSDTENKLYAMREQALPILEAGGVDLVLCGHSHNYERSFFIDGHYGKSDTLTDAMKKNKGNGQVDGDGPYTKSKLGTVKNEGAVYVVAGSSGKTGNGSLDHPVMVISHKRMGSLVLDVNGNHLDATFVEPEAKVTDTFRIIKGGGGKDITPPALVAAARVDATHLDLAFSEKLDPKIAVDPTKYTLQPVGGGKAPAGPKAAELLPDGQTVRIEFLHLDTAKAWRAAGNGICDPAGNVADPKVMQDVGAAKPEPAKKP